MVDQMRTNYLEELTKCEMCYEILCGLESVREIRASIHELYQPEKEEAGSLTSCYAPLAALSHLSQYVCDAKLNDTHEYYMRGG